MPSLTPERSWIVDASPLIFLGRLQRLEMLFSLAAEIIIPEQVAKEVWSEPARSWVEAHAYLIKPVRILPAIAEEDLGSGETAMISLAIADPAYTLIIDDLAARNCARSLKVKVIGTVGVLVLARQRGIVPRLRPLFEELTRLGFRASAGLLEKALRDAGE